MKTKSLAVAILLATTSSQSFAKNNFSKFYAGFGFQMGDLQLDENRENAKLGAIKLEAGYDFIPYLGLEAHAIINTRSDDVLINDDGGAPQGKTEFSYHGLSLFAKGTFPIKHVASIYGLAGGTRGKFDTDYKDNNNAKFNEKVSDYEWSFAYGLGMDLHLTPRAKLGLEAIRYFDKKEFIGQYNGLNLTFSYNF
ncbi:porin family protein [Algicola sagamiensis]|uniref:porin family protein n=1 Tax=Algicola sagamiensis TaxID=163869 RepID=UPI00036F34E2|nr:porin family protein [Algicola sagamiensis]